MGEKARTRTKDQVLVDDVYESPVDREIFHIRRWLVLAFLLIVVVMVFFAFKRFGDDVPVDYTSDVDHFKYGSIGSEPGGSLLDAIGGLLPPEQIFAVLPEICPEKLPGSWESLGFVFEEGHALPIGVAQRRRLGFDQVGLNCAVCHTGTYRETPASERMVVAGMPAHQLELQEFTRFLFDCTLDERFTAANLLGKIEEAGYDLGPIDRFLYRFALIPRTREATLEIQRRIQRILGSEVTAWGHGRVDTFNPYKAIQFNWKLDQLPAEELTGASDFPSLWNQAPRDGMDLHWDGNNDSVDERNLSASLGAGVTPVTIDHERLARVREWIWTLPPPPYPWQNEIDQARAAAGKALYNHYCAACHAFDGPQVGTVLALAKIGTDPYRLNSYTYTFAANQYTLYPDSEYAFRHFRKTDGYANQPLDGVWARAPYLHNGSVPTLRDLLEAPEARPAAFYRGYDVFDRERVGFVADVARDGDRELTYFDTSLPGNGNGGHVFGTQLEPEQKDALVEYMKTL